VTTIYVTHDQTEAMTLGDLVAVMKKGVLQQLAAPDELYSDPVNLFVAGFIGSPAMNMVEASIAAADGSLFVDFAGNRLRIPEELAAARPALAAFAGRTVILGMRPEGMDDAELVPGAPPDSRFPIVVDVREGMGSDVYLHFTVEAPPVVTEDTRELAADLDEQAVEDLQLQASQRRAVFIARADPETTAQVGQRREVYVDTRKLYFFDPATGDSIVGERSVATVGADGRG
jgi:multiple sugar transport system ATP-binding protein